jgi:hypothetical protein
MIPNLNYFDSNFETSVPGPSPGGWGDGTAGEAFNSYYIDAARCCTAWHGSVGAPASCARPASSKLLCPQGGALAVAGNARFHRQTPSRCQHLSRLESWAEARLRRCSQRARLNLVPSPSGQRAHAQDRPPPLPTHALQTSVGPGPREQA